VDLIGGPFQIIGTIIVGALAGYLASIIVGTNKQQGCIADIVVGLIGAIIGRAVLIGFFADGRWLGGFLDTLVFSIGGAVILLLALQLLFRGRRRRRRRRS
jgi:uncharacterized membrane protein YeaQ/YmgE (transglycosylase-associated protein family)